MRLSIVLPVYNEEDNLGALHRELTQELSDVGAYEIIAVDDGSRDKSREVLKELAAADKHFKVISLSKNYGQTAALSAGFDAAVGEVIIPMDADRQNDPKDIPRFLQALDEGYDVVAGWRKNRQDKLLMRRIPSLLANKLISRITGVRLHDYGCTMKAYRREVLKDVRFYGEMHRFMPVYTAWHGARIKEMVVNHRPRVAGVSKYGISRTFRVILDLLTVKFLMSYLSKPMHFFGWAGFGAFFFGALSGVYAIVLKFGGVDFDRTPLPLLTVFFVMTGVQFVLMGLLAEILIRIYHEPRGRATYTVRNTINFDEKA